MEWVASTLRTTSEHGLSSITTADAHTSAELTPTADLNGFVRFAERRNLYSARVPSHFRRSIPVASLSGVKCAGTEGEHSPTSCPEVANELKYTLQFVFLHGVHKDFTLCLYLK
jgi:hypothetical protein